LLLDCIKSSFPCVRVGCSASPTDGHESCLLFLSLNHFCNVVLWNVGWMYQVGWYSVGAWFRFPQGYEDTLVFHWFLMLNRSNDRFQIRVNSGYVMKLGEHAEFESVAWVSLSAPFAGLEVFVKSESNVKAKSFLNPKSDTLHRHTRVFRS
jgi:hypothetical protein